MNDQSDLGRQTPRTQADAHQPSDPCPKCAALRQERDEVERRFRRLILAAAVGQPDSTLYITDLATMIARGPRDDWSLVEFEDHANRRTGYRAVQKLATPAPGGAPSPAPR